MCFVVITFYMDFNKLSFYLSGCCTSNDNLSGTTKWWRGSKAGHKDSHPIPDRVGTSPQGEDKGKRAYAVLPLKGKTKGKGLRRTSPQGEDKRERRRRTSPQRKDEREGLRRTSLQSRDERERRRRTSSQSGDKRERRLPGKER